MSEKRLELVRGLGPAAAMAMVVGHIIGTGVFLVPSAMARATGSAGLVFLVWIVGGALSLFGALTIAELGAAMPEAGGAYVYLKRGFGPLWGFLFGWMNNLVGKPASISTIAAGFLIFAGFFVPGVRTPIFTLHLNVPFTAHRSEFVFTWAQPLAAAAIALVSFINYLGVRLAGRLQVALTCVKIGAILAVVVLGFLFAGKRAPSAQPFLPPSLNLSMLAGFLTAMVGALWAYDGWIDLTFAGSEIVEPQKNIPRALVGGTITVGVIYLLANAVYFRVLPFEAVASAPNVASETVRAFAGKRAAAWITAAMVVSHVGISGGAGHLRHRRGCADGESVAGKAGALLDWVVADCGGAAVLSALETGEFSCPQRGVKLVVAKERALPADPPQGERLQGPTPSRTEP